MLAWPADDLSWFACYFSLYILWSEYFLFNKVGFEAQQASVRAARSLDIFCKNSKRFSQCLVLYIASCLKYLFSMCLSLGAYGTTRVCGKSLLCVYVHTAYWGTGLQNICMCLHMFMFTVQGTACAHMSCWLNVCKVAFDQLPVHVISVSTVNGC